MAYSDRQIIAVLKEFQGREITVTEIAASASMPYGTVKHGLKRLQKAGQILREGRGRKWGSTYRIVESKHETV